MKINYTRAIILFSLVAISSLGCSELGNGLGGYGGDSGPGVNYGSRGGYGYGGGDPYYEQQRNWQQQREIDRQREDLERQREQIRKERWEAEHIARPPIEHFPIQQPPRREEHCPSGYSPSENKCSSEERKHGCSDMRLPGGLGCVRR